LSSSLAQSADELWTVMDMGMIYPGSTYVGVELWPIFGF